MKSIIIWYCTYKRHVHCNITLEFKQSYACSRMKTSYCESCPTSIESSWQEMCSYDQITFGEYHYSILNPASPTFQPAMVHEDPDCPICDPIMATGNASHIKPLYRAAFGQGFSFGFYHQFGSMMDATSLIFDGKGVQQDTWVFVTMKSNIASACTRTINIKYGL